MSLVNIITSLLFSVIDLFLIKFYFDNSTQLKVKSTNIIYFTIAYIFLFIINADFFGNQLINPLLFTLVMVIILQQYILNNICKLKILLLSIVIKFGISSLIIILFEWVFNTQIFIYSTHWIISYKLLVILAIRYLQFVIVLHFINKYNKIKLSIDYFKVISLVFSIYFVVTIIVNSERLFYFQDIGRTFVFMIIVYNIALIMFDRYQTKAEHIEKELFITKQNIDLEKGYIKKVGDAHDEMRGFRHDIKNKATITIGLINAGLNKEAVIELERILGETVNQDTHLYVNNVYIDTVIDAKVDIIKNLGVEFEQTYGVLNMGSINSSDFALAVGLAMDNAIEAVEKVFSIPRKISIDIRTTKNYVVLTLTNSIIPGSQVNFNCTSKTLNKENHGYGVKKIKKLASTYNGDASFEVYDDTVVLRLYMSNNIVVKEK